ncbi:DUF560 domain-containing protein [Mariprofundus sp. EBB-1]|uniref:outer membrane beta-barrel protein n=1 Tax=Mariprofundus sp. EBB-1 TaxID=2650971 RepID=UPI000EF1DE85|nr:outer membrane beta-barrel protein [Mariprofundus sp. EBB-1]RLL55890.1 DUF560 domain-containing protein [Mariprofundus sp. EBB-1]
MKKQFIIAALMCLTTLTSFAQPGLAVENSILPVTVNIGNIRSEANTSSNVLFRLKKGTKVFALKQEGDWVLVNINNTEAWAHHSLFGIDAAPAPVVIAEPVAVPEPVAVVEPVVVEPVAMPAPVAVVEPVVEPVVVPEPFGAIAPAPVVTSPDDGFDKSDAASSDDGFSLKSGGVELIPSIKIDEKYNDNIFSAEAIKTKSLITVISPRLELKSESDTHLSSLSYQLDDGIYHSSSADNYLTHDAQLNVSADLSRRLQTSLQAGYLKSSDPRGSTFTGRPATAVIEPDKFHTASASAMIAYGIRSRVELKGDYSAKRYENNRFRTADRDLDNMGGGLSFFLPIMQKTKAVVEARYKKVDYKTFSATTNLDSKEQRYFGGLDWEATAKTSGKLRLGYMVKSFDDSLLNGPNSGSFSWELGMNWAPESYSIFDLSTESTINEADGSGSHIEAQNVKLGWNHDWNSKLSHTASVGFAKSKYIGLAVPRQDDRTTAGLSIAYQIVRWLNVSASYDYTNNNSSAANSSYKSNVYGISLMGKL